MASDDIPYSLCCISERNVGAMLDYESLVPVGPVLSVHGISFINDIQVLASV